MADDTGKTDAPAELTREDVATMIADALTKYQPPAPTDDEIAAERQQFESLIEEKLKDFKPALTQSDIADALQGMDWHAIAAEAQAKAEDGRRAANAAAQAEREKSQAKAEKEAGKRADAAVKERSQKQADAGKRFAQLFGAGSTPATADLSLLPADAPVLLLDNGETFCVDFTIDPLDRAALAQADDRGIRLDRKLELGKGIEEPFTVRGVDLVFGASDALRCELATPLTIGAGREAHIPSGDLVFRAKPPASTEAA